MYDNLPKYSNSNNGKLQKKAQTYDPKCGCHLLGSKFVKLLKLNPSKKNKDLMK